MIRVIVKEDLPSCLEIFHLGYETVAIEFGLTEENCPDIGRASLPFHKLISEYENGTMMFAYLANGGMVGFLGMKMLDSETCGLDDIIVLPAYRRKGYGTELLAFCIQKAREIGAKKIRLGMIDNNKKLRKWYEDHGFVNVGYKQYNGTPFTVGKMECIL